MKKVLFSLSIIATVTAFTGCSKNSSSAANNASVMFVNGCVLATNIDAKVNNVNVTGATNIALLNNSGYENVVAGTNLKVSYYLSSPATYLDSAHTSLTANTHYSVFAGGSIVSGPQLLVTTDDLTSPGAGSAKVRLVNLSSDSLSTTAYIGTNVLTSGVTINSASAFYSVTAGSYVIKAGDPSNISTVVSPNNSLSSISLGAGKIYTLVYTGTGSGSGTSGYTLTVVGNN